MTDPLDRLEALGDEPVPAEIVLSAVRLFRYRAIATIGALVAGLLLVGLILTNVTDTGPSAQVAELEREPDSVRVVLGESVEIEGIEITLTEVIWHEGTGFVRVVAQETLNGRPEPEVMVDIVSVETEDGAVSSFPESSTLDLDRRHAVAARWIQFDAAQPPVTYLAVDALVLPVPQEILDEGGELSSEDGTTTRIVYERNEG